MAGRREQNVAVQLRFVLGQLSAAAGLARRLPRAHCHARRRPERVLQRLALVPLVTARLHQFRTARPVVELLLMWLMWLLMLMFVLMLVLMLVLLLAWRHLNVIVLVLGAVFRIVQNGQLLIIERLDQVVACSWRVLLLPFEGPVDIDQCCPLTQATLVQQLLRWLNEANDWRRQRLACLLLVQLMVLVVVVVVVLQVAVLLDELVAWLGAFAVTASESHERTRTGTVAGRYGDLVGELEFAAHTGRGRRRALAAARRRQAPRATVSGQIVLGPLKSVGVEH